MAVNLHLHAFRFGKNGGTESTHGWYGAENTNVLIPLDTTFLLRMGIQQVEATAAANLVQVFQAKVNAGAWFTITTSSTYVKAVTPSTFANDAHSTTRLTGTLTGNPDATNVNCTTDGTSGGTANDVPVSGHSETVCGLQILDADCNVGDVVSFQLTISGPTTTLTIDVVPQAVVGTLLEYPLGADALGSYADAAPTVDKRGILKYSLAADANAGYADTVDPRALRLGWVDSVVVEKATGLTPIPVSLDADALGSYADAAPTVDKRGNHFISLSADALGSFADAAPTIDKRGNHFISLTADALGSYADVAPTIDKRGNHIYSLEADAWGTLADAANATLGGVSSTPITVPLGDDAWGTLADAAPTIDKRGNHIYSLSADALGSYADAAPTIDKRGNLLYSLPTDALGTGADSVAVFLTLSHAPAADSWATLADSVAVTRSSASIQVALAADAKPLHADAIKIILGELVRVPDTWREGPITVNALDANAAYGDSVVRYSPFAYGIDVALSDANAAYADVVGRASPIFVRPGEYQWFDWTWGAEVVLGFNIYYGTSPGATLGYIQLADPNARSIAITAVVGPGAWYISVAAYNATGAGPKSNEVFHQYTLFADSVRVVTSSVNIGLTDAKLAFADTVKPILGMRILPAADANNAYTDAVDVNPFYNLPAGMTDANEAYADAVIVLLAKPYALTDANAAYTSTLIHAMGYYFSTHIELTPPADAISGVSGFDYFDSVSVHGSELVEVVTPADAISGVPGIDYTDAVTVTLADSSDLQFNMTEAMNAYVDNLLRGLTLSVDVPDDAIPEPVDALGSASGTGRMHPIISSRGVHSLIYGGMLING